MQISVTFRNVDPSVALRQYAEEKISRIKKYFDEPIDAHVILKVEKFRHSAEVVVNANGLHVNGTEETDDMYSAIDKLADTIEAQAKKSKDKTRRRKSGNRGSGAAVEPENEIEPVDIEEARIIRTEQVYAKPMDVDEAVMQLNLSNGEFMVFSNRHTNRINVLYRRKDGHYGLIETSA